MVVKVLILIVGLIVLVGLYEVLRVVRMQQLAREVIATSVPYEQEGVGVSILVAGDSTGYGTGAADPADSIAGRLGVYYPDASVRNISKNGNTVHDVVVSLEEVRQVDLLVLQVGGNDILQFKSTQVVRKGVRTLLERANERAADVIFMSTGDVGATPGFGPVLSWVFSNRTRTIRNIFIEEAEAAGVTYVDLYEPPQENQFLQDPERYHSADGLHPSGEGYGIWFEKMSKVL